MSGEEGICVAMRLASASFNRYSERYGRSNSRLLHHISGRNLDRNEQHVLTFCHQI